MIYILDSNILVHAVRESNLFLALNKRLKLTHPLTKTLISTVTIGELYSLSVFLQKSIYRNTAIIALKTPSQKDSLQNL